MSVLIGRIKARMATAKNVGDNEAFTATSGQALHMDLKICDLLTLCLAENDRRLAPYDNRLKRPRFVPFMARVALKFIGPKKKVAQ